MWSRALPLLPLFVLSWTCGCGSARPAVATVAPAPVASPSQSPPLPPPIASAPPPAPSPPQPKCESFAEHCLAEPGSTARVANSLLVFTPPSGLLFAQEEAATVAQLSDAGAIVALAGYDVTESTKVDSARAATYEGLVRRLGVVPPKGKFDWKASAHATKAAGTLTLSIYNLRGATRGGRKGEMGIFVVSPVGGRAVLGVAFVPQEDDVTAPRIIAALETLHLGPPTLSDDPFADPRPALDAAPVTSSTPVNSKGKP